jgi:5-formyltetrahydrofolate cyclo-ligase
MDGPTVDDLDKEALRTSILERRKHRSAADRAAASAAMAAHLLAAPFARVERVATYLSMRTEPDTSGIIDGFTERGIEVIVPVTGPNRTLDWVVLEPDAVLTVSPLGIPEPAGPRLGPDALADAGLVIVPALAADHTGCRLGRGAGYFDRALPDARGPICALVYGDELIERIPHEAHDVRVDIVVTEAGIFRVP